MKNAIGTLSEDNQEKSFRIAAIILGIPRYAASRVSYIAR